MASGLGTGTRPLRGRGDAKEKGREWKTQPHPGAPCLGQRTVVEARPLLPRPRPTTPARHTRIISFQREVGVGGSSCPGDPSFRSVMSAARRAQKGAFEISARTSQTSAIQTLLSCVIVVSHCTSLCLGIPTWKTGCIHLPPGRLVNRVTGQVPNAGVGM